MGDNDILGAWYMWPDGGFNRPSALSKDSTLIVYFHGNSQDRGFGHRVGNQPLVLHHGTFILFISTANLKIEDLAILGWLF